MVWWVRCTIKKLNSGGSKPFWKTEQSRFQNTFWWSRRCQQSTPKSLRNRRRNSSRSSKKYNPVIKSIWMREAFSSVTTTTTKVHLFLLFLLPLLFVAIVNLDRYCLPPAPLKTVFSFTLPFFCFSSPSFSFFFFQTLAERVTAWGCMNVKTWE